VLLGSGAVVSGGLPVPGQDLGDALARMFGDATEYFAQVGSELMQLSLSVSIRP